MVTEHIGAREHRSMKHSQSMKNQSMGSHRTHRKHKSTKEFKLRYSGRQIKARKRTYERAVKAIQSDKKNIEKNQKQEKKLQEELGKIKDPQSKSYQNKSKNLERLRGKNMELIVKTTNDVKAYNEANYQYFGALADDFHTLSKNLGSKISNAHIDLRKLEQDPNRREEAFQQRLKIKKMESFKEAIDIKTEQYYKQANQLN